MQTTERSPDTARGTRLAIGEFDLANGLHVLLHRDNALPVVAINLWYHVGSKNEQPGRTGFAHLFEHLMFQGSANVPANGHFQLVQEAGGSLNASTSYDRTNYFETLPSHRIALGLWLEADRMFSLAVTPETLETQRSVVMEERRARYDNQPYGTMYEELFRRAYRDQPYRWPVIGSMDDIRAATLEDVRAFHALYYRPSNATLCIAGDFDPAEAEDLTRTYFEAIPDPGSPIPRAFPIDAEPAEALRDSITDNVPLPAVIAGYRIPPLTSSDYPALDVLAHILGSGSSSWLHHELVYKRQLAQSAATFAFDLELPGLFIFLAHARRPDAAPAIEQAFRDILAAARTDGVREEELDRARNRMESEFLRRIVPLQQRADTLNGFHVLEGGADRINAELERIRGVSLEDVRRVAARYLGDSQSIVLHVLPAQGKAAA